MSKTFREWDVDQGWLLPPSVHQFVPPGHLAHFVRDTVREGLDLSAITGVYTAAQGQPPYHPGMLTALLLYGYSRGIYSSRQLARACEERVDMMAVTGLNRPDFRTISDFRKRHLGALSALFVQVLRLCQAAGLVKLGHVAVDGTKLRANASKHKAMSYGRMLAQEPKLAAEVQAWLRDVLPDPAAAQIQQHGDQAADNLSVSNALGSLRAIGDADWPVVIARTSRLMGVLLASPVFEAEDPATRGHTLHAIERLARRCGRSEVAVARSLLTLMQAGDGGGGGDGGDGETALASHWLRGPGRPALLRALGLHERVAGVARSLAQRWSLGAYLGVIAGATLALTAGLLMHRPAAVQDAALTAPAAHWALLAMLALLVLLPASEAVLAVVNRLISESLRPKHLPRLALACPALVAGLAPVPQALEPAQAAAPVSPAAPAGPASPVPAP